MVEGISDENENEDDEEDKKIDFLKRFFI